MKIAYILTSDIARFRGSTLKIWNQVEMWKKIGHEVEVFARVPDLAEPLMEAHRYPKTGSFFRTFFLTDRRLLEDVIRFDPDCLYIRQGLPNRTYFALQNRFPNVIEIVSDDREEYRHLFQQHRDLSHFLRRVLNGLFRRKFLRKALGLICGTYELAGRKHFASFSAVSEVVPNSVYMDDSPGILKSADCHGEGPCRIFFIGSPGFVWHGTDKMEKLADTLGPDFHFHVVGLEGNNRENLEYHGYLKEEDYLKILSLCHICLSTFALHRKNQNECTTIKFCEYVKHGFPVIVPYKETSLIRNGVPSWILEIPNDENVLELPGVVEKIRDFCRDNRNRVVGRDEARPYIDSYIIEKQRLDYMESLLPGSMVQSSR